MHEREAIVLFLKSLRDQIICGFESLEPEKRFERTLWNHRTGGGGEISLLRGEVFEKAAVNWSGVSGESFPMQDGQGPFFCNGSEFNHPYEKSSCSDGPYEYSLYSN